MTRKPPSETSAQDAGSRRDRLVARRTRRIRIIVAVVVVAIAGAVAVAAYALNDSDPQAHAVPPNPKSTRFGAEGTLVAPNAVKAPAARRLDPAHPLRLWIGGDSLAGLFGPALGDRVGATGVAQTVIDYRVSSGLWSNDLRNWYQRATDQMASADPEAIVFMIGANDTPVVNRVDANGDGVPDWQAEYRMKVARMMDVLLGPKRRSVIWLGPPTMGTRSLDAGAKAIGQVMREEALKRAPGVVYLDTYKLFSTADGTYSRRILDETGKEIVARIGDGVHFSTDGAQYLARAVFSLIDARWHLSTQADLAEPIGWTLAPGSGEALPGSSSTPRSRYRPRRSSPGTTAPPATVAEPSTVATSPPTTAAAITIPPTVPPTTAPRATVPPTTVHVTPRT